MSVQSPRGIASVRDVAPPDIDSFIRYWHFSGEEHLEFLGIDRKRLGTPDETRERFLRAIRSGDVGQPRVAFSITLEERLIGYTNLNRHRAEENYPHLHLIEPSSRAAGVATILVPHILKLYFDLFPIERLAIQTRTRNLGINRVLDKCLPVAETRYFEGPDGLAGPGEFHMRYLSRETLPGIFGQGSSTNPSRGEQR